MEAKAVNKYIKQSAKKMKPVADMVRGKRVDQALNTLHFMPKKAAKLIEQTIRSAVANFINTDEGSKVNPEELFVKMVFVNQGPTAKRIQPRSMGRAFRIRKRSAHLTVVVANPEVNLSDTKEKE